MQITSVTASVLRGDAIEIMRSADARVVPECAAFGPGGCGGCDFQHIDLGHQRALKATVLSDQLRRLAGIEWSGQVEAVPGDVEGLGWRTRVRYLVRGDCLGMRVHRSHRFVPLPATGCLLAVEALRRPRPEDGRVDVIRPSGRRRGPAARELVVVAGPDGSALRPRATATVQVSNRDYLVDGEGFWQLHPGAPTTLVAAVLAGVEPRAGERALDLYCGSGLFAGALVDQGVTVTGIEANAHAIGLARRNVPEAVFHVGEVATTVSRLPPGDIVVLDPPRTGVGREIMTTLTSSAARVIAYISCDPASLGRDLADLPAPWSVTSIRAFDLFPMTHHMETVAVLQRLG